MCINERHCQTQITRLLPTAPLSEGIEDSSFGKELALLVRLSAQQQKSDVALDARSLPLKSTQRSKCIARQCKCNSSRPHLAPIHTERHQPCQMCCHYVHPNAGQEAVPGRRRAENTTGRITLRALLAHKIKGNICKQLADNGFVQSPQNVAAGNKDTVR